MAVFERDGHACVVCGKQAVDAHHLYERRLWSDGGYRMDNLVSVCEQCHKEAEATLLSVELLAELAEIDTVPLPDRLEKGSRYDKWGNPYLPNGQRMRGVLFYDTNVQRALEPVLHEFTKYVKYPRTPHLQWSPGATDDDIKWPQGGYMHDMEQVVVTEKMDGECTTIYDDFLHARSVESGYHESRTWVKNFAAKWQHELSPTQRVCGENVYAVHSIEYEGLQTYFYGFSMWDDRRCLSWENTLEWFELLGIVPAPVLFEGTWAEFRNEVIPSVPEREGYVVRAAGSFMYDEFHQRVAKYVRENHVQTTRHWKQGKVEKNRLA